MQTAKSTRPTLFLIASIVLAILLVIQITDQYLRISNDLRIRTVPFILQEEGFLQWRDPEMNRQWQNWYLTELDSIQIHELNAVQISGTDGNDSGVKSRFVTQDLNIFVLNMALPQIIGKRDYIDITLKDSVSGEVLRERVETVSTVNYLFLAGFLFNIILILFTFTNSWLLLRYSKSKENLLVVAFLVLLFYPSPDRVLSGVLLNVWLFLLSPFWGVVFYHFVVIRTGAIAKLKKLYSISAIVYLIIFLLALKGSNSGILQVWSAYWFIRGYLLLRKSRHQTASMPARRLLAAFGGLGFSLLSAISFLAVIILISLIFGVSALFWGLENINGLLVIIILLLFLLPLLGMFSGILWFMGAFSWGILTGTALDVKIRSSLIYTLVGVIFVTCFGLLDYALGEMLQSLFGNFIGSEFIAGIPATIGILVFFNPIRNRIETVVDQKLNSSELDFINQTEAFTRNLSREGVQEGFEEYICENLIRLLPISKVALVVYDSREGIYRFNEIRGSQIPENDPVDDRLSLLGTTGIIRNSRTSGEEPAEIASFAMIVPILYEAEHKWYLALGSKQDGSSFTRKDEEALQKLAERIKLSLKFILDYEQILQGRIAEAMNRKDLMLKEQRKEISRLQEQLQESLNK
ncbi:MAG: hypothetical protein JW784_03265 [Candidatus Cloacimonetes bacterium]|nr:hypothetical protein [Candidatus Cloacimonadota bacterium]